MSKKSSAKKKNKNKKKKSANKNRPSYVKSNKQSSNRKGSNAAAGATEELSSELENTMSEDSEVKSKDDTQPIEEATVVSGAESDSNPQDETEKSAETVPCDTTADKSKAKKPRAGLIVALIIAALILLPFAGIITYGVLPHRTEIGDEIHLPLNEHPIWSEICDIKTNLEQIDTNVLGRHPLELEFFGFIPIKSTLVVHDSTAPTVQTHTLYAPRGIEIPAKEFINSTVDKTNLKYAIRGKVDSETGGTVKLKAVDECGNRTNASAELVISDLLSCHEIELGTKRFTLTFELIKDGHLSKLDYSDVNFSKCGTYPVRGELNGKPCFFYLTIVDTTAPQAKAVSRDILLGNTLSADDFLSDEFDRSEIIKYFEEAPDFKKVGKQPITVILEDTFGNRSRINAVLCIHDLDYSYTVEVGTPSENFKNEIVPKSNIFSSVPHLPEDTFIEQLRIGTHEILLQGEFSMVPIEVTVIDTVAPVMTLKPTEVFLGIEPNAADFVESCDDASEVTFSFSEKADTSLPGEQTVTIVATDAAGNFTSAETTMYVIKDTTKPVIYGVKPLVFSEGEIVSYRSGVYAVDNRDGDVTVNVNSSRVNTSAAGVYYITYSATDKSGNTATVSTTVTIGAVSRKHVDALADRVISRIITASMTQREKAEAIYKWCSVNIRYSSLTAHLMGNFNQAAYTGLTKHYGNCYTYYAVSSALLSRVGIENIEIHRNDPSRPHYWNLVKMNGAWYHFDTCPQPSPHRLRVFLLTDSEVRAFPLSYYYNFDANNYPATP